MVCGIVVIRQRETFSNLDVGQLILTRAAASDCFCARSY